MTDDSRPDWRAEMKRIRRAAMFEHASEYVVALSRGDRAIFSILALGVVISSIASFMALEQALLVQVPTYGGTLSEGEIGSPQFINPLLAISDADRDLSSLTYAGLMGIGGKGNLVPVLASDYTVSDDGKIYTFTLRPNALFTDGTPITADDVVFTVKKAQDPALKSPEYANWSGVSVVAVDKGTVRFTLTKPYSPFIGLTTLGILPAHLWQSIGTTEFPFSTLETNPVGNGPFKIVSISRDASGLIKSVSLGANQKYVLGRPYLDEITFTFYTNSDDKANALKNGSIESAYGIPSTHVVTAPYARVFGVFWNPDQQKIYARTEVRKALSLAIDRKAIITSVLGGYATPILGPVPPGGNVTQTTIPTTSDPITNAAQVLTMSGWTYDGSSRVWQFAQGGTKAKLTIPTITIRTSNVPELKNVAGAVKAGWEKLGVGVAIELYEPGDLSQNVIRPRKYDALLYGEVIGRDQDLYAFWDSQERNDPGLNIALYANKSVDTLLENARTTTDTETRVKALQKIEDLVSADYPAAFIYSPDFIYAIPSDLSGVVLPQIITPSDRFATIASWYRATDAVWPFFAR